MSRRAPVLAGVVMALLSVLLLFFLVLPKMDEVSEMNDQLQAAQDQEIALEAQLRALQQAQAQAPETEQAIAAIEDQIPPTADLPSLFRLLQSAADRSAVDFFSFAPSTPVVDATSSYSTILSTITVSGGYFSIDEFLFLLETLPRAAKTTTIAVAPSAGTDPEGGSTSSSLLSLQATVEFYTTDISAGPGSVPGPTQGVITPPGAGSPTTPTDPGAS